MDSITRKLFLSLFFSCFTGNTSTSSERKDVQGFMYLLCCNYNDFLQCCNFWVLGIWKPIRGSHSYQFPRRWQSFGPKMVHFHDEHIYCTSTVSRWCGEKTFHFLSFIFLMCFIKPQLKHHCSSKQMGHI